jgi:Gas vesicle protein
MTMTDAELSSAGLANTGLSQTRRAGARLADAGYPAERVSLIDLLDRVLAGGVVVTGEITLSIADVDLVVISLRALLTSVSALVEPAAVEER